MEIVSDAVCELAGLGATVASRSIRLADETRFEAIGCDVTSAEPGAEISLLVSRSIRPMAEARYVPAEAYLRVEGDE
jgi:hypothetical protein